MPDAKLPKKLYNSICIKSPEDINSWKQKVKLVVGTGQEECKLGGIQCPH